MTACDASPSVTYAKEQEQEDSVTNVTGASAPSRVQEKDPKTAIWDAGSKLLGSRTYVGSLVKKHGEAAVFHAIAQTITHAPADPKAYVRGLLKPNSRNPEVRESGLSQAEIEQAARPGETYEQVVHRLRQRRT